MLQRSNKLGDSRTARRLIVLLTYLLVLTMLLGCSSTGEPEPREPEPSEPEPPTLNTGGQQVTSKHVVWGKADLEPTDAINKWQPTVDFLAANLGDVGIDAGEMKIAPDSETLGHWMADGEVDLIVDSLYPAMVASHYSGAVPLAVRKTGKPDKHAVFFVRAESNLDSLPELKGKNIAFAEPDSTSGFMLPHAHLREMGFKTKEQPATESAVGANQIGYVFAGDDDVVVTWVLEGRVIAGAVDNLTFAEFNTENPGMLAILSETVSISSNTVVLIRNDIDPAIATAIKTTLLAMKDTEEGQTVLRGTKTVSFDDYLQDVAADWVKTGELFRLIKD